jgi:hypothetical protein
VEEIIEITLEEIFPENNANKLPDVNDEAANENNTDNKPVDMEIMAVWSKNPAIQTKGHKVKENWWLVYHPEDNDWYYLPDKNVKPIKKKKFFGKRK